MILREIITESNRKALIVRKKKAIFNNVFSPKDTTKRATKKLYQNIPSSLIN
jgi:ABC-type antimicrobial peptide transport system ATPase subunit